MKSGRRLWTTRGSLDSCSSYKQSRSEVACYRLSNINPAYHDPRLVDEFRSHSPRPSPRLSHLRPRYPVDIYTLSRNEITPTHVAVTVIVEHLRKLPRSYCLHCQVTCSYPRLLLPLTSVVCHARHCTRTQAGQRLWENLSSCRWVSSRLQHRSFGVIFIR